MPEQRAINVLQSASPNYDPLPQSNQQLSQTVQMLSAHLQPLNHSQPTETRTLATKTPSELTSLIESLEEVKAVCKLNFASRSFEEVEKAMQRLASNDQISSLESFVKDHRHEIIRTVQDLQASNADVKALINFTLQQVRDLNAAYQASRGPLRVDPALLANSVTMLQETAAIRNSMMMLSSGIEVANGQLQRLSEASVGRHVTRGTDESNEILSRHSAMLSDLYQSLVAKVDASQSEILSTVRNASQAALSLTDATSEAQRVAFSEINTTCNQMA